MFSDIWKGPREVLTLSGPAFLVVRQARGWGGLRGPNAKNQS